MNAIPYRCPRCCEELVETEEGTVQNFYGRLIFPKDPRPYLCRNCETPLVRASEYVRTEILDSPA